MYICQNYLPFFHPQRLFYYNNLLLQHPTNIFSFFCISTISIEATKCIKTGYNKLSLDINAAFLKKKRTALNLKTNRVSF